MSCSSEKVVASNFEKIKSYNRDAAELLSRGPENHPYATGIKKMKIKRGKSAPPGAPGGGIGPLEEENESNTRPKLRIKFVYDLDEKKRRKKRKKRRSKSKMN